MKKTITKIAMAATLLSMGAGATAQDYLDLTTYAISSYPYTTSDDVIIDTTWTIGYDYYDLDPSSQKVYYHTDGTPTTANQCSEPMPFEPRYNHWISWGLTGKPHTLGEMPGLIQPYGNVIAGSMTFDWELRESEFSYTFSKPVNNIVLYVSGLFKAPYGTSGFGDPDWDGRVTFSVNGGGIMTLTSLSACDAVIEGSNTILNTAGVLSHPADTNRTGSMVVKVSSTEPFTEMTLHAIVTASNYVVIMQGESVEEALPVKLMDFSANKSSSHVILNWATATEQNNKDFEVEHSSDSKNWQSIAHVNSKAKDGNSYNVLNYTFTDNKPLSGQNFYRLKQTDFDGKHEYSPVRSVSFSDNDHISLYPNPADDQVTVKGLSGTSVIELYDISGKRLRSAENKATEHNINLSDLSDGIYYIRIQQESGNLSTHKILKLK